MNQYTEQFVTFYSIDKLNTWLKETADLITVTYKRALVVKDELNIIVGFHIKRKADISYNAVADHVLKLAE